ncbi:MAG: hypothetical protein ACOZQL_04470 [Myxococcota bacterium]
MDTEKRESEPVVECVIAMVWPGGVSEPVCEMFRVDRRAMRWSSKHYSSGSSFVDGGRLYNGETARTLAESGTGSGVHRYLHRAPVTFVVASIDESIFEATGPTDWSLEKLLALPDANVTTFH